MVNSYEKYHDIFISFSFADEEIVDKIVDQLYHKYDISYWMCTHDLHPGLDYYDNAITAAIKNAQAVVLIQSYNSVKSEEVPKEIRLADSRFHKPVIPFSLDNSQWDNGIAYLLQNMQQINATNPPSDESIALLADSIYTIIGRRKESAGSAAPLGPPRTFEMTNLSVLNDGRFLYLGNGLSSFSPDTKKCCLYDKANKNFVVTQLSPLQIINDFAVSVDTVQNCDVMFSNDSHYFAILNGDRLRIFDMTENRWITSPKGNAIRFYKSQIPLFIFWLNDTIVFMCGQRNKQDCKVTTLTKIPISPQIKPQHFDISNLEICGVLKGCYSNKQGHVIFYNRQCQLLEINLTTLSVKQDIDSEYLNQLTSTEIHSRDSGIDQFSPDCKMYGIISPNGGLKIYSTDEELLIDDIYFNAGLVMLPNGRSLILDKTSGTVSLNDYISSTKKVIFNDAFFLNNELFYHSVPFCFEYDVKSNTYVFFVKNSEAASSRIVCVNAFGNPVTVSDEVPIAPGIQGYVTSMRNDILLLGYYIPKGEKGYRNNSINTYIYGASYYYTANGELILKRL